MAAYTQFESDFQKIKEEQKAKQTDKTQHFYRDIEEVVFKQAKFEIIDHQISILCDHIISVCINHRFLND